MKLEPKHTAAVALPLRYDWIDQLKGFTIFLVVYGHNFPFCEKYIYSFHMPLFIMVAGFFHSKNSDLGQMKKRFIALMIPYFLWSIFLFSVWYFVTRNYGDSALLNLSPIKNFIGIFTAQGDREYMDWGIPMWFLPALFVTFLFMWSALAIRNRAVGLGFLFLVVAIGLIYPHLTRYNLPWSINIAMVSLFFYAIGFYGFQFFLSMTKKRALLIMVVAAFAHLSLFDWNGKVDMYRAIYGNEMLFLANGATGSVFFICFFKLFPVFKFLAFIGKFSLTILALQLLAMTFIKLVIMSVTGQTAFDFSEAERFIYAIVQIALMVPFFLFINKYIPLLNGGHKKI